MNIPSIMRAAILAVLLLGPAWAQETAPVKAAAGPAVLFVTHWGLASGGNEACLKRLVGAGARVHTAGFDKITPELLAAFDTVVIPALPPVNPGAGAPATSGTEPADNDKLLAALDGYLVVGGGLLFAGPLWGWDIGWDHLAAPPRN